MRVKEIILLTLSLDHQFLTYWMLHTIWGVSIATKKKLNAVTLFGQIGPIKGQLGN